MKILKKKTENGLKTTESFIGESLEDKVRRTMLTNAPIEAISPMVYTERKEGVRKDTDIRTDRWEVAQSAMETITMGARTKRAEKTEKTEQKTSSEAPSQK